MGRLSAEEAETPAHRIPGGVAWSAPEKTSMSAYESPWGSGMPTQPTAASVTEDVKKSGVTTIGDIVAILTAMVACNIEMLSKHAKSLIGPRTRGSTTTFGLDEMDQATALEEFAPAADVFKDGCRYFRCPIDRPGAVLGVTTLGSLKRPGGYLGVVEKHNIFEGAISAMPQFVDRHYPVRVRWNETHGYEVVIDRYPEEVELPRATTLTVIVEEFPGFGTVVSTWHPGVPFASSHQGLTDSTAVKLHNGGEDVPAQRVNPHLHVSAIYGDRNVPLGSAGTEAALWDLLREARESGAAAVEVGNSFPNLGFPNGIFSGDYETKVVAAWLSAMKGVK
jgi:hypothetical protein